MHMHIIHMYMKPQTSNFCQYLPVLWGQILETQATFPSEASGKVNLYMALKVSSTSSLSALTKVVCLESTSVGSGSSHTTTSGSPPRTASAKGLPMAGDSSTAALPGNDSKSFSQSCTAIDGSGKACIANRTCPSRSRCMPHVRCSYWSLLNNPDTDNAIGPDFRPL